MDGSHCIRIPAILVPYFREGIRGEISAILEDLVSQTETVFEPNSYRAAFSHLDEVRELFETIGITNELPSHDIRLDLSRWSHLMLRVLERQYSVELGCLEDRAVEGLRLSPGAVPELGRLIDEIREKVWIKSRESMSRTQSTKHIASSNSRRHRSDSGLLARPRGHG
jgi:hypothetical protein